MAKSYKVKTNVAGFAAGSTVTEQDLKDGGHDAADWQRRGILEDAKGADEGGGETPPGHVTGEGASLRVAEAIRDETAKRGRALSVPEQDEVAARVVKESGRPTKAGVTKETDALERQQAKADRDAGNIQAETRDGARSSSRK
jgi:hypothetical protein